MSHSADKKFISMRNKILRNMCAYKMCTMYGVLYNMLATNEPRRNIVRYWQSVCKTFSTMHIAYYRILATYFKINWQFFSATFHIQHDNLYITLHFPNKCASSRCVGVFVCGVRRVSIRCCSYSIAKIPHIPTWHITLKKKFIFSKWQIMRQRF